MAVEHRVVVTRAVSPVSHILKKIARKLKQDGGFQE